jgi:arylsulfatase A-like enzyme
MTSFSRRDFLKAGSLLTGALGLSQLAPRSPSSVSQRPNVIILVFDAMSAKNLALYGYRRKTAPNMERFAQRSTVFHQHYSTANFTTPGTASLLTGLYPWTHRAINYSGLIARERAEQNIFKALGQEYHRLAFSQNMWPNYFFAQFGDSVEKVLSPASFSLFHAVVGDQMQRDLQASHRAFEDFMFVDGTPPASLIFGLFERIMMRRAVARTAVPDYPRGLPRTANYPIFFQLKHVFDGLAATVEGLSAPYFAYLHAWSPHDPYKPSKEFDAYFADGWRPKQKPEHELGTHIVPRHMTERRQNYDEYVANVDFEFGRLLDTFEAKGVLENSYVVVTSDHGDMFERGVEGHLTPLLYDPVVRIPLLIAAPGQAARRDVRVPTSSVSVLPTLVHLAGGTTPAWCEGPLLPGLGGPEGAEQSVYMMDAKEDSAFGPLRRRATFALRKGAHKLIYYAGFVEYGGKDKFEMYDIENDPEELNDLYSAESSTAAALQAALLAKVNAENARMEG